MAVGLGQLLIALDEHHVIAKPRRCVAEALSGVGSQIRVSIFLGAGG